MPGTLAIANLFAGVSVNQPGSALDADLTGIRDYVNNREIGFGTLAARPAAGTAGRYYVATDTAGGTLYADNGSAWVQLAAGVTAVAAAAVPTAPVIFF